MKTARVFLFLSFLGWSLSAFSQEPQQLKKDFVSSFTYGEMSHLKVYFNGFVNMNIPGGKGFYSDTKAKWLLQDFFQKYKAKEFLLKENGYSGDNYYLIGQYSSHTTHFGMSIFYSVRKITIFKFNKLILNRLKNDGRRDYS